MANRHQRYNAGMDEKRKKHGRVRAAILLVVLAVAYPLSTGPAIMMIGLREGDRLLTVLNSATHPDGRVVADLVQGDRADPSYVNFWPLVGEFYRMMPLRSNAGRRRFQSPSTFAVIRWAKNIYVDCLVRFVTAAPIEASIRRDSRSLGPS